MMSNSKEGANASKYNLSSALDELTINLPETSGCFCVPTRTCGATLALHKYYNSNNSGMQVSTCTYNYMYKDMYTSDGSRTRTRLVNLVLDTIKTI